jgi:predicted dehydrogenase
MTKPVRILVVGLGNMGASHASAYHRMDGFEIVGLCSRTIKSKKIPGELGGYPLFENYEAALAELKPDAVSINTWPNTHADYAIKAMDAGAHVFMEKPIGTSNAEAEAVVAKAREKNRKLVLGYILRVHPSWIKFIEIGKTLGKPLVMRLNLNQQSSGDAWMWHKNLIDSLIPIVDCGVHYVDVMCQLTGADVPADGGETRARPRHRRRALGRGGEAELRPPPRHVRRRFGRLVRGRLGADDVRNRVLREGHRRAEGFGLSSSQRRGALGGRRPVRQRRHRQAHQDRRHPSAPRRGRP